MFAASSSVVAGYIQDNLVSDIPGEAQFVVSGFWCNSSRGLTDVDVTTMWAEVLLPQRPTNGVVPRFLGTLWRIGCADRALGFEPS